MFDICASAKQRDRYIGQLGSCQNAAECFLPQKRKDLILPVLIEGAVRSFVLHCNTAPRFGRLQQDMHFRVMAEGFKMSYALHRLPDCFPVDNSARTEGRAQVETLL